MPRVMDTNPKKRAPHPAPPIDSALNVDVKPAVTPPAPIPSDTASLGGKRRAQGSAPASPAKKVKKKAGAENGTWTTEKRAGFLEDILMAGYKSADFDALAIKYGLGKTQLLNQLTPGRSNLRSKIISLVKAGQA